MNNTIIAIDVGAKRVGVASTSVEAKLPTPLTTLDYKTAIDDIVQLVDSMAVQKIVVGIPTKQDGTSTDQTEFTEAFITELRKTTNVPIMLADEAFSSVRAKEELLARGKTFAKADVDALAAAYILEDYLTEEF